MANKKLVDLLRHFGEVEVNGEFDTHSSQGDKFNNSHIIFTRNEYIFEMDIEVVNDKALHVSLDYMVFKGECHDIGLLNLTKRIISFIDDLDKIKVDKKVIWGILIRYMKDKNDLPARNLVWELCNDLIMEIPELEDEEDLLKEFVEIYNSKMP